MAVTANGTVYTVTTFTAAGATYQSRMAVPDTLDGEQGIPLLLYCHGAGGNHTELTAGSNLTLIRNAFLDAGWALLEADAGGPHWGNDTSRDEYRRAFIHARATISVGPVVCMGRSMGGIPASYAATQDPVISPHVRGLLLNSAVQSLAYQYGYHSTHKSAIRTAYGFSDDADFDTATAGHDPLGDYDADVYAGLWVAWWAGDADDVVPYDQNSEAMHAKVSPTARRTGFTLVAGADHGYPGTYTQHAESLAAAQRMVTPFTIGGQPAPLADMRVAAEGELRSVKLVKMRRGDQVVTLGRHRWFNP